MHAVETKITPFLIFCLAIIALISFHYDPASAVYVVQIIAIIAGVLGVKRNLHTSDRYKSGSNDEASDSK